MKLYERRRAAIGCACFLAAFFSGCSTAPERQTVSNVAEHKINDIPSLFNVYPGTGPTSEQEVVQETRINIGVNAEIASDAIEYRIVLLSNGDIWVKEQGGIDGRVRFSGPFEAGKK